MTDTVKKIGSASTVLGDAEQLAASAGDDELLIVTFTIGDQTYGGDILQIQEVTSISRITRVPHVKDYIKGVTNLRGNIVPTLDLRARLNVQGTENTAGRQIMIAKTELGLIGYIADSVREVISVPKSAIEPTPEDWLDADHQYFIGIAKLESSLVTLVDFSKIISSDGVLLEQIKQG